MPQQQVFGSANGPTRPIILDAYRDPFAVSLFGVPDAGSVLTWKVEFTGDDPALATDAFGAGLTWFDHATLVGQTGSGTANVAFPVRAVRGNLSGYASGRLVLTAIQAGLR